MSILTEARSNAAAAVQSAQNNRPATEERKTSELWLNVGFTLKGAGEDGADLFVSIPRGIPLDDLKIQDAKGNNVQYIQLVQAKNHLLTAIQKVGASLKPGERQMLTELEVDIYRAAKPESTGNADENPLIAQMLGKLGVKPETAEA